MDLVSGKLDNLDTEAKTQQEVCGNLFVILNHLEVLRDDWKGYVKEAKICCWNQSCQQSKEKSSNLCLRRRSWNS